MTLQDIPRLALDRLDRVGWWHGGWKGPDGQECAHQAVRACSPETGDGYIVSAYMEAIGYGAGWNDAKGRTEQQVRDMLAALDPTDENLERTFGPDWRDWVALVRLVAKMTPEQARLLRNAAGAAAEDAAWDAAEDAAWDAAWGVARGVARGAAWNAAWDAAGNAAWDAAWDAAGNAAGAVIAKQYIGRSDFTQAHYDLLMSPIIEVFGEDWREQA